VYESLAKRIRQAMIFLLCATAVLAGCHSQKYSYYGTVWGSLTSEPSDFAAYIVTIDSIVLTRSDGQQFGALETPELVDLTQVQNIAELWGSSAVPTGTYTTAAITIDYTSAQIYVKQPNGTPVLATVYDAQGGTGVAATTYAVNVLFDPNALPNLTNTFATTSATLLAIDFDMSASNIVSIPASGTPTVGVRPYLTVGTHAADNKLIRIRGPLINSSTNVNTYTVYVRPFYDEANNIGQVTMFSTDQTVYSINGNTYTGNSGLDILSNLSAGTTVVAGYTQLQTDYNALNGAYAGKFNLIYVVGASTLEDIYTEGISGDVIARTGDTLTLHGSTVILNTADTFDFLTADSHVYLGPATIVTADDNNTLKGLTSASIAVGDHITVRGEYSLAADGTTIIDATGVKATNTGSVRLQTNEIWGPLVASTAGGLTMNVETINNWPVSLYNFAGNGSTTAGNPLPASFSVDAVSSAGTLTLPAGTAVGNPVWVDGYFAPFGAAPPDFNAVALANESSVQLAGTQLGGGLPSPGPTGPGTQYCGVGSAVCDPAQLLVIWKGTSTAGTATPFASSSDTAFTVSLTNADFEAGVIRIGAESIALSSLAASPTIQGITATNANPTTFSPRYTLGNPATATSTSSVTASTALHTYDTISAWMTELATTMSATNPALELTVRGYYDRTSNTFYATLIDFVL
jgi:hypothetical protein